ncbi:hypothetical protein AB833_21980 [Chromatiales bacterium (ex Bugula neritina AB1)]|nr:hypothetical protein AB833_21980 [Chromatiales bacterium (ex Bugula neritina AB1)]
MKENRRSYVRIQAEIGLIWRLLDDTEVENINSTFQFRSRTIGLVSEMSHRSDELVPAMRNISGEYPEIASWIKFLHSAVETLAEQISQTQDNKTKTIPQQVIISAAGIEFQCSEKFAPGQRLELIIELLPSKSRIMVVGEVVRETDNSDCSAGDLALAFTHIRDADQELLIRHIHRAQLEELQRARVERKVA